MNPSYRALALCRRVEYQEGVEYLSRPNFAFLLIAQYSVVTYCAGAHPGTWLSESGLMGAEPHIILLCILR